MAPAAAAAAAAAPVADAPAGATAAAPPTAAATEAAADLRKSVSAASLDSQQRAKGTATNSKWARYDSAAPRQQRRLRQVHLGETLSAAVLSTGRLRLLLAALLALLLAVHWDAAAAAGAATGGGRASAAAQQQRRAQAPLAELAARWQGLVQQAKHAAAPLLGRTPEQAAAAAAEKRCRQLWAGVLDPVQARVADAAATAAAKQQPLAAWQRLEASAALAATAAAGASCRLYGQAAAQVAAARAASRGSPWRLGRQALAAAVRHGHAQLAAAAASPLGQQALGYAEALPPLASLLLLELSLVGAAAAAMAAAPRLVHSTVSGRHLMACLLVGCSSGLVFVAGWWAGSGAGQAIFLHVHLALSFMQPLSMPDAPPSSPPAAAGAGPADPRPARPPGRLCARPVPPAVAGLWLAAPAERAVG